MDRSTILLMHIVLALALALTIPAPAPRILTVSAYVDGHNVLVVTLYPAQAMHIDVQINGVAPHWAISTTRATAGVIDVDRWYGDIDTPAVLQFQLVRVDATSAVITTIDVLANDQHAHAYAQGPVQPAARVIVPRIRMPAIRR